MVMNRLILEQVGKGGTTALGDPDALPAYACLPEVARAAVAVVALGEALPAFADIPLAGHAFPISDPAASVSGLADSPITVRRFPV